MGTPIEILHALNSLRELLVKEKEMDRFLIEDGEHAEMAAEETLDYTDSAHPREVINRSIVHCELAEKSYKHAFGRKGWLHWFADSDNLLHRKCAYVRITIATGHGRLGRASMSNVVESTNTADKHFRNYCLDASASAYGNSVSYNRYAGAQDRFEFNGHRYDQYMAGLRSEAESYKEHKRGLGLPDDKGADWFFRKREDTGGAGSFSAIAVNETADSI